MAYLGKPGSVSFGGTGDTTLTTHGVLVGEGTSAINALTVGTNGQVLLGSSGADPSFVTPTAGSGLSITTNASTLSYALSAPVSIANGGTNATSMTNTEGVTYYDGTRLVTSNAGSNGQVMLGATGAAPAFATLTSTGGTITFTTGPNSLNLEASAVTLSITSVNSTPYNVLSSDYFLAVDATGSAITIKLPNAPATGRSYVIKDAKGQAATHNITITTVGGAVNIDGATSLVMNGTYQSISVIFDGTAYEVF